MAIQFKNIPRDVVADKRFAKLPYSEAQWAAIDANIYRFYCPDWSGDSWARSVRYFKDTADYLKEDGNWPA